MIGDLYHLSEPRDIELIVCWDGTGRDPVRKGTKPDSPPEPPRSGVRKRRSVRVSAVETRRRLLLVLRNSAEPMTKQQLRKRIDTAESTTNDAIALLVHQGLVQGVGVVKTTRSKFSSGLKLFALTPDGEKRADEMSRARA